MCAVALNKFYEKITLLLYDKNTEKEKKKLLIVMFIIVYENSKKKKEKDNEEYLIVYECAHILYIYNNKLVQYVG